MKSELISILNWLISLDPEKCDQIFYKQYKLNISLASNINFNKYKISDVIPFFWQAPDPWGSLIPGADKGNTWLLFSKFVYAQHIGITGVLASGFHSLPPDGWEGPIHEVDNNVLVASIQLLLKELVCIAKPDYGEYFRLISQLEYKKSGNILSKLIRKFNIIDKEK